MTTHIKKAAITLFLLIASSRAGFAGGVELLEAEKEIEQYGVFSLYIELPYFNINIDDPSKIKVNAILASPSKKRITMPLFCVFNNQSRKMSKWQLRFNAVEEGTYSYYIEANGPSFMARSTSSYVEVKKSAKKGFLRRSEKNPYYLKFDSGEPFFGIGYNVGWAPEDETRVFDRYFSEMQKNGCNIARVWICDWSFPLEWEKLGTYNRASSDKLDKLIELAAKRDIYVMLCLDTYGSFMEEEGVWKENKWKDNPYNSKNGGPCKRPIDFFEKNMAKRLFMNKLRYIIARWSAYPNVFSFELVNEYNVPPLWARETARYMNNNNPNGQFVTLSIGYPYEEVPDEATLWSLKELGLITLHEYGNGGKADVMYNMIVKSRGVSSIYKKPFIFSEFGIDFSKDDKNYDITGEGITLHNSLWASAMLKCFGTTMNWWWDTYIRPNGLNKHYKAIAEFLKGVDWDSKDIEYLSLSDVMKYETMKPVRKKYTDVVIDTIDVWKKIHANEFTILSNGDVEAFELPNKYLHGTEKKKIKTDHIYNVNYPASGEFIIHVGTVSQGGHIRIYMDGKEIMDKEYPAGSGEGPWKRSMYLGKHDVYQCVYDEDLVIKVAKGKHTIRFRNTGRDWMGIDRIILKGYVGEDKVVARCLGLKVGEDRLIWIQDKKSNWKNGYDKFIPQAMKRLNFKIFDIDDGEYRIEWWDTYKGTVIHTVPASSIGGVMEVDIPEFTRDIACKIKKEKT